MKDVLGENGAQTMKDAVVENGASGRGDAESIIDPLSVNSHADGIDDSSASGMFISVPTQ